MSFVREVLFGESVQNAIDAGPGMVLLEGDRLQQHGVSAPVVLRRGVTLRGANHEAIIRATASMNAVVEIGQGSAIDHWELSDLTLDGNGVADNGVDVNIIGTGGNYRGEPDARGRLSNLEIYFPVNNGIWYRGQETRATYSEKCRVRAAGLYAFLVESADNWFVACEGTTAHANGTTNRPGAGFGVYSANCHFAHCKGWYVRSHGWHVRGSRNTLIGCEAQDVGKHGFFVEWDKNILSGCMADTVSSSQANGIPGQHDGFYVTPSSQMVMTGCVAFDRQPSGLPIATRHGFNITNALNSAGLFGINTAWNVSGSAINKR